MIRTWPLETHGLVLRTGSITDEPFMYVGDDGSHLLGMYIFSLWLPPFFFLQLLLSLYLASMEETGSFSLMSPLHITSPPSFYLSTMCRGCLPSVAVEYVHLYFYNSSTIIWIWSIYDLHLEVHSVSFSPIISTESWLSRQYPKSDMNHDSEETGLHFI